MSQEKKKMPRRRILSFMLALCMILTAFPATSLWAAEERADNATVAEEQAIETEKGTSEVTNEIKENLVENQAKSGVNDEDISDKLKDFFEETEKQEIDSVKNEGSNPDKDVTPGQRAMATAKPMSGTCGKNGDDVRWRLEPANNYYKLIISGKGKMADYDYNPMSDDGDLSGDCTNQPWFWKRDKINTLVIEKGVTYIGTGAFCDLGDVREGVDIVIPDSVNTISDGAFAANNISNIIIPSSVGYIGKEAFSWIDFPWGNSGSSPTITMAEGISYIGDKAFSCSDFSNISIPNSVTHIGKGAFQNCLNLRSVTLSNSVTSIEPYTFACCELLSSIVIPDNATHIGVCAFDYCISLKKIIIPGNVTNIGYRAFYDCDELTDVYYSRSKEIWDAIDIGNGNKPLTDAKIHYNSKNQDEKTYKVYTDESTSPPNGYEEFNCSLEDCLKDDKGQNKDSSEYNPQLAHMLIAMCNSVHDTTKMSRTFENFGFHKPEINCKMDNIINYGIGAKKLEDGKSLVLVVVRGTGDPLPGGNDGWDPIGWLSNIVDSFANDKDQHSGFSDAAKVLYDRLTGFLGKKDFSNIQFVITGHSRGAAASNILAARLIDENVDKKNIYSYNFACPDTAIIPRNTESTYDCIFNISNVNDPVSWLKGLYWSKYGKNRWYCDKEEWDNWEKILRKPSINPGLLQTAGSRIMSYHLQNLYLGYLRDEKSWEAYKDYDETTAIIDSSVEKRREYNRKNNIKVLQDTHLGTGKPGIPEMTFFCPVDVKVYGSDGVLVGRIADNTITDIVEGKVYISVDDDDKYIYILDNDTYTVKLSGTDQGTMSYAVRNIDINTADVIEEQVFINVTLAKGKQMESMVKVEDNVSAVSQVQLLVLDDKGEPEKEVLTDGKGTEVPIGAESITPSPSISGAPSVTGSPSSPGMPSTPGTEPSITESPTVTETPSITPDTGTETPTVSPTPPVTTVVPSITPTPTTSPTPGGNIGNGVMVKRLKITGSSKRVAIGKKLKLKATVSPANATNKAVTWKSNNTKYAIVNNKGIVTIKKSAGGKTVTITATAKDGSGIKASYKLKCMKGIVKKVAISGKKNRTIKAGKSIKLKAKAKATEGANKTLKWSSSNTKYAKVNDKGKVITKKAGKGKAVKITATATDGSGKKGAVKIKLK